MERTNCNRLWAGSEMNPANCWQRQQLQHPTATTTQGLLLDAVADGGERISYLLPAIRKMASIQLGAVGELASFLGRLSLCSCNAVGTRRKTRVFHRGTNKADSPATHCRKVELRKDSSPLLGLTMQWERARCELVSETTTIQSPKRTTCTSIRSTFVALAVGSFTLFAC